MLLPVFACCSLLTLPSTRCLGAIGRESDASLSVALEGSWLTTQSTDRSFVTRTRDPVLGSDCIDWLPIPTAVRGSPQNTFWAGRHERDELLTVSGSPIIVTVVPNNSDPEAESQTFLVERVQTGVRIDKNILKVLKALAESFDMTLGDLIEGIVLHVFDGKLPFDRPLLERVAQLKKVYGLELDYRASHRLVEAEPSKGSTEG
jgi:hypothetical protein